MKTDIAGYSTTKEGQEQWEEFYSPMSKNLLVQYDYRDPWGKLFSCVAGSLEKARERRDSWLRKQQESK